MLLVYAYIIVIFIRPQDWVPLFYGIPVSFILIPLGILVGLSQTRKIPPLSLFQSKLILCYFFVIILSILVNGLGSEYLIDQVMLWGQRILLFFMILLLVNTEQKLKKTTIFFVFILVILGVQAVQQGVTGVGWNGTTPFPGYSEIRVRWLGDWDGPNVYALIMAVGVPIFLEFALDTRSNVFYRAFSLLCMFILLLGVYFTNSRGAVLGLGATISLQLFLRYVRSFGGLLRYLVIVTVLFVLVLGLLPSRMGKITSSESSAGERTWLWENGLIMLRQNPVLGVGKGQFSFRSPVQLRAHNNFVQVFSETGMVGYFLFIAILWFSCARLLRMHLNRMDNDLSLASRGLVFGIVCYCFITFFVTMENDALFILLGLLAAAYSISMNNKEIVIDGFNRYDLMIVLGVMGLILVTIWLAAITELL